jgi:hypothetical protein
MKNSLGERLGKVQRVARVQKYMGVDQAGREKIIEFLDSLFPLVEIKIAEMETGIGDPLAEASLSFPIPNEPLFEVFTREGRHFNDTKQISLSLFKQFKLQCWEQDLGVSLTTIDDNNFISFQERHK